MDLLHQVDDEIQARVDKLVSLGELAEDEGRRRQRGACARRRGPSDGGVRMRPSSAVLQARNVPTCEDIERLSRVIDQLDGRSRRPAPESIRNGTRIRLSMSLRMLAVGSRCDCPVLIDRRTVAPC